MKGNRGIGMDNFRTKIASQWWRASFESFSLRLHRRASHSTVR